MIVQKLRLEGFSCLTEQERELYQEALACPECDHILALQSGWTVTQWERAGTKTDEEMAESIMLAMGQDTELGAPYITWSQFDTDNMRTYLAETIPRWGGQQSIESSPAPTLHVSAPARGALRMASLRNQGQEGDELWASCLHEAQDLRRIGRTAQAISAVVFALKRKPSAQWQRRLVAEWLQIALQDRRDQVVQPIVPAIRRTTLPAAEQDLLLCLVSGWNQSGQSVERLLVESFCEPKLEFIRSKVLAHLAGSRPHDWERFQNTALRILDALELTDEVQAMRMSVEGLALFRRREFAESLSWHKRASVLAPDLMMKFAFKLNATLAALSVPDLDQAEELAGTVWLNARQRRIPTHQAHAHRYLRTIAYRRGVDCLPDEKFIEVLRLYASAGEIAFVSRTEASFAWRKGRVQQTNKLASLALSYLPYPKLSLLIRTLATCSSKEAEDSQFEDLANEAIHHPSPEVCIQVLGLLASVQQRRRTWCEVATARSQMVEDLSVRRDVLSIQEALDLLGSSP